MLQTLVRDFHKMEMPSRNKTLCQQLGFVHLRTWWPYSLHRKEKKHPEWTEGPAHKTWAAQESLVMPRKSGGTLKAVTDGGMGCGSMFAKITVMSWGGQGVSGPPPQVYMDISPLETFCFLNHYPENEPQVLSSLLFLFFFFFNYYFLFYLFTW